MSNFSVSINYGFSIDEDERFRLVKEAGFSAVGLWWGKKMEGFDVTPERQFELANKYGLAVDYVHAPFNYHKHLRDEDKTVRDEGICEHKKWIDVCHDNNVDKLVIHLNRLTQDEYVNDYLIDSLKQINEYALNKGVKIAVENIGRPDDLQKVFDNIDNIYFCIDSSHANLAGDRTGRILDKYIDHLVCTHFSDNDGLADRHWPLGYGEIDFENMVKILKKGGYKGRINCEVVAPKEYQSAKEFLFDLYSRMEKYFGELNF